MTPSCKFYEKESSLKSLGIPICTIQNKFCQDRIIFEEVKKFSKMSVFTATILNVVDSQFSNGHIIQGKLKPIVKIAIFQEGLICLYLYGLPTGKV